MHRFFRLLPLALLLLGPGYARQVPSGCGTYRDRFQEDLQLHRKVLRLRREAMARPGSAPSVAGGRAPVSALRPDVGDIALIEDTDGVVARRDDFNLDHQTLVFAPSDAASTRYRVQVGGSSYDAVAAGSGALVGGFGDDDTRQLTLPFDFPFFGAAYRQIYVNSDGNLTFVSGDNASIERSLGRLTAGPPRIAPLFEDLDPTQSPNGVSVFSDASRFVVSWVSVPEYSLFGLGTPQTFQVRLYPDGRIEFAYAGVRTLGAVVGIAPGGLQGSSSVVSFIDPATQQQEFSAAVAERFGTALELDVLTATQKFYDNHEDSYDYLVIFNNLGIPDGPSSLASELTVRTHWIGNGDLPVDNGAWFGSPSRLASVINMGPLSQYPNDLTAAMPQRPTDSPISILAHESGHLFLAYASIPNPNAPDSPPMLGGQNAHWSFNFNSDASLLEGNRIADSGAGVSPRFQTTGAAQHFSPLDQYLMGFRAAQDVPPSHALFYVPDSPYPRTRLPQTGVRFNGTRRDVPLDELIAAVGRRTPDYTIAQRRFRVGFMLVLAQGTQPSEAELAKLNNFRTMFEAYYQRVTACDNCQFPSAQPSVDTTLRHALRLSIFPMAGVLQGGSISVTVSVLAPLAADLTISLSAQNGLASVPPTVVIPAGSTSVSFTLTGVTPGVEDLFATPADVSYETAYARVQVVPGAAGLMLTLVSGGGQVASPGVPLTQPIVFRVTDINNVSYPGLTVRASVTSGGSVTPPSAPTDATGSVSFQWTPGAVSFNHLTATLDGGPSLMVPALGRPAFTQAGVVNAASFTHDIGAGSIIALFGENLWTGLDADAPGLPWPASLVGVRVLLNGQPAQLTAVREGQINFVVPSDLAPGTATVVVSTSVANSDPVEVPIASVAPAVFRDAATSFGAVQVAGTGLWTNVHPAQSGDYVEIYLTGLGPVHLSNAGLEETDQPARVFLGTQQITDVPYCGLVPGYVGLYQINARIPAGASPGVETLSIESGLKRSNIVNILLRP